MMRSGLEEELNFKDSMRRIRTDRFMTKGDDGERPLPQRSFLPIAVRCASEWEVTNGEIGGRWAGGG